MKRLQFNTWNAETRTRGFRAQHAMGLHLLPCFLAMCALTLPISAVAQQKTGPGIGGDDALTYRGITLYGVVDIGVQYDTHGAPFSAYRPSASGNIVQKNSRGSVFGVTPSNMGQSRVGLQGVEPLSDEFSAIFRIETFFNPQSGEVANALKSLTTNNGKTAANSSVSLDGSSAGQAFQTAFAGFQSKRFGTLTFGRQLTLLTEGTVKYDPNYDATAFGLIGASGSYQGGGSSEDKRLDSMIKYYATFADLIHAGVLYKFSDAHGGAGTATQAVLGAEYAGASFDVYYSKIRDAISAVSLTSAQVGQLPTLGYSATNSIAATISDNTTYAAMAYYTISPLKFFAGFEHIKFVNPANALGAGYVNIGGYVLAFVNNSAYNVAKNLQIYWSGVRYRIIPKLDLTAAYYGYHQDAYGTGAQAGCNTSAFSTCSGNLDSYSFDADFYFSKHFDGYAGAMYSGVHHGAASGYTFHTTNINPTIGVRVKF